VTDRGWSVSLRLVTHPRRYLYCPVAGGAPLADAFCRHWYAVERRAISPCDALRCTRTALVFAVTGDGRLRATHCTPPTPTHHTHPTTPTHVRAHCYAHITTINAAPRTALRLPPTVACRCRWLTTHLLPAPPRGDHRLPPHTPSHPTPPALPTTPLPCRTARTPDRPRLARWRRGRPYTACLTAPVHLPT